MESPAVQFTAVGGHIPRVACCRIHPMTAMMPRTPRARTVLVFVLVLLPLILTAVFKYLPALTKHPQISSVAILHPHLIGPKTYLYLEDDVAKRLHYALHDFPAEDVMPDGNLAQLAKGVDASALIV